LRHEFEQRAAADGLAQHGQSRRGRRRHAH
jgi:hypothetical protein